MATTISHFRKSKELHHPLPIEKTPSEIIPVTSSHRSRSRNRSRSPQRNRTRNNNSGNRSIRTTEYGTSALCQPHTVLGAGGNAFILVVSTTGQDPEYVLRIARYPERDKTRMAEVRGITGDPAHTLSLLEIELGNLMEFGNNKTRQRFKILIPPNATMKQNRTRLKNHEEQLGLPDCFSQMVEKLPYVGRSFDFITYRLERKMNPCGRLYQQVYKLLYQVHLFYQHGKCHGDMNKGNLLFHKEQCTLSMMDFDFFNAPDWIRDRYQGELKCRVWNMPQYHMHLESDAYAKELLSYYDIYYATTYGSEKVAKEAITAEYEKAKASFEADASKNTILEHEIDNFGLGMALLEFLSCVEPTSDFHKPTLMILKGMVQFDHTARISMKDACSMMAGVLGVLDAASLATLYGECLNPPSEGGARRRRTAYKKLTPFPFPK